MHPVYHAKITVSTKNFPRSEGRKCGVKGLVQWRGLMVWSRSWFRTTKGKERVRVSGILEFTTLDDEVPGGPQSFGAYIISQATGFLRYAAKLCSKSFDHTL